MHPEAHFVDEALDEQVARELAAAGDEQIAVELALQPRNRVRELTLE